MLAEWADKYKGAFDQGWDKLREETFARQKQLGVIPADAELTPRPAEMPAWESLNENQKRLYARQMEVYAGYSENADWNIGRVVDAIEEMGDLDNTLVIFIWGDNGASMEGTLTGSFNEWTMINGLPLTDEQQLQLVLKWGGLEAWGTELMAPHYSAAWAWAGDCPFQWGKQVASHLGGTRNPMVVHWPQRITQQGGLRSQFTHVTDVGPTILEAAGVPQPSRVDGVEQQPMHGTSFTYSFDDASVPERHGQQYFEILGNRGMYKDGWWLSWMMPRTPWKVDPETIKGFAPGIWDPASDPVGTLLPARRLLPGQQPGLRAPGEGAGAPGALPAGSREVPCPAAARWADHLLRDDHLRCPPSRSSPITATSRTSHPG